MYGLIANIVVGLLKSLYGLTYTVGSTISHTLSANLLFSATNTYDIGASGATQPRTIYVGTSIDAVGTKVLINTSGITLAAGVDIICATSTGTKIGTGTTQLIAFHNSAPVAQRSGAAQAAVVTTGAALASYGYTEAQANSIVTLVNELRAALVEKGLIKGSA